MMRLRQQGLIVLLLVALTCSNAFVPARLATGLYMMQDHGKIRRRKRDV